MSEIDWVEADALVAFGASNVWSYRDSVTLSLQATRLSNPEVVRNLRTAAASPARVLPVAGVFGANASGKSTVLKAMESMARLVRQSFKQADSRTGIPRVPFLLDDEARRKPSSFEVELILSGVVWEYGFEIDNEKVLREFASHYPRGRRVMLFERSGTEVTFGPSLRPLGKAVLPLLADSVLLLSIMGAVREERLAPLFEWFQGNLTLADSSNRVPRSAMTATLARDADAGGRVLELLRAADLGLTGLELLKPDEEMLEKVRGALRHLSEDLGAGEAAPEAEALVDDLLQAVQLSHRAADGNRSLEPQYESLGTQVWVSLIGVVLHALQRGSVLLVDELDASLHPLLVDQLVELFQSPATNPHCAQLIFNSHDVALLDASSFETSSPLRLGRDHIWLTEKEASGSTVIFSLAEFRTRKDEALARRYLRGRYGAVPKLSPSAFHRAARTAEDASA